MPRDTVPAPFVAELTAHTLRCFSDRRAEFFAALDRVGAARRKNFVGTFGGKALHGDLVTIAKGARVAAPVLP